MRSFTTCKDGHLARFLLYRNASAFCMVILTTKFEDVGDVVCWGLTTIDVLTYTAEKGET